MSPQRYMLFSLVLLLCWSAAAWAQPMEGQPVSALCPTGGPEAERLYQLGVDYHKGRKGLLSYPTIAAHYYEEAISLGNAKAMINLGVMQRVDFGGRSDEEDRLQLGLDLFKSAWEAGCPEGLDYLAAAYFNGWGVRQNESKAYKYLAQAAEAGSLGAMTAYGNYLFDQGEHEQGKRYLEKALSLGDGYAGYQLYFIYGIHYQDAENMLRALRRGAALGNADSMCMLSEIYRAGKDGQEKDPAYAEKLYDLCNSVNRKYPPIPVDDFDRRFPPKPARPWQ